MELIVIHFPDDVPGDQLVPEVRRLVAEKIVSIVDLAFITRAADGEVSTYELSEREGDDRYEMWDEVLTAIEGLISDEDMAEIAEGVEPGMTAAVLLFEHTWAQRFSEIVRDAGGELAFAERIPATVADVVATAAA
ncbi:MAG TPA: DUF6325 family protein [Micromonosporaceae bacterium]|jgi:uncharacterized membrane protein